MRQLTESDLELIKNTLFGEFGIYRIKDGIPETLYISDTVYLACGMTREEYLGLTGKDSTQIILPSDRQKALADIQHCVSTGEAIDTRYRALLKNSSFLWIRARGHICGMVAADPILCMMYTSELNNTGNFRAILDNIDCSIYICDRYTREFLYANREALHFAQDRKADARIKNCHQLFFGLDTPCNHCILNDLEDTPLNREFYVEKVKKWLEINAAPMVLGGHEAAVLYIRDITAQKNREKFYASTIEQLRNLYTDVLGSFHLNLTKNWCGQGRSSLDFVLKQQESGTVDGYFAEFARLIADRAVQKEFFKVFDRKRLIQAFYNGQTHFEIDYPIQYADGIHWRTGRLFMFENPSTSDIEAMTVAIDIDKRKKWELIVHELIDTDFDFVSVLNVAAGTITEYTSNQQSHYEGGKLKDIAYMPAMEAAVNNFIREDCVEDALRAHSIEVIKTKLAENPVYRVSFPTRDNRIEAWRISYLTSEKNDVLIARRDVTRDIEKERNRMRELKQAKREAEKANAAKTSFFARINHDMRTPLNGVLGYTDLASRTNELDKIKEYLFKIHTSGKLLLSLINDVLDFGKYASKKITLHPEPMRIENICDNIRVVIQPLASDKDIDFNIVHHSAYDGFVEVDSLRIQQLLVNLLSNAVKFTKSKGHVNAVVTEKDCGDSLACTFVIRDNGIGMEKEFLPKIFDAYTQEERAAVSKTVGTGLGMAIVKEIVELMQGDIQVESTVDVGTVFTVHLSLKKYLGRDIPSDTAERDSTDVLKGKRVLLCEDNELNAEIAQLILQQWSMEVFWVENGQAAVEEISKNGKNYDIVLMDKRMPVMDGLEAAKAIRRLESSTQAHVRIIAMTGDVYEDSVRACLEAGMDAHIGKPIDTAELARVMVHLL